MEYVELSEIIDLFYNSLEKDLKKIADNLFLLEKITDQAVEEELVYEMFRVSHNIKGVALAVDMTDIADIAYSLETLFRYFKKSVIEENPRVISQCMNALDCIRKLMQSNHNECEISFKKDKICSDLLSFDFIEG